MGMSVANLAHVVGLLAGMGLGYFPLLRT
jgi:membrane associated rhomboid family serine protease